MTPEDEERFKKARRGRNIALALVLQVAAVPLIILLYILLSVFSLRFSL